MKQLDMDYLKKKSSFQLMLKLMEIPVMQLKENGR